MEKVRTPVQQRSQEKKQRIIDVSYGLFCHKGLDETNTKEIARAAGVSVGTFYSYFEDKVDVLLEIVHQQKQIQVEDSIAKMLQNSEQRPPFETIYMILRMMLDTRNLPESLQRQVSGLRYSNWRFEEFHKKEEQVTVALLTKLIESFGDEVCVPDKKKSAQLLLLLLKESFRSYTVFEQNLEKEDFLHELSVVIYNYLFVTRPELS